MKKSRFCRTWCDSTGCRHNEKSSDGGIDPSRTIGKSDVCVCGMMLGSAAYFGEPEKQLESVVDFILSQQLPDGGFNCRYNRSDGKWPLQAKHPGRTHFEMEEPRRPSRWNTLLAFRVLKKYDPPAFSRNGEEGTA